MFRSRLALNGRILINATLNRIQLQQVDHSLTSLTEVFVTDIPDESRLSTANVGELVIRMSGRVVSWNILSGYLSSRKRNSPKSHPRQVAVLDNGDTVYIDVLGKQLHFAHSEGVSALKLASPDLDNYVISDDGRILASIHKDTSLGLQTISTSARTHQHCFKQPVQNLRFDQSTTFLLVQTGVEDASESYLNGWHLEQGAPAWQQQIVGKISAVKLLKESDRILVAREGKSVLVF